MKRPCISKAYSRNNTSMHYFGRIVVFWRILVEFLILIIQSETTARKLSLQLADVTLLSNIFFENSRKYFYDLNTLLAHPDKVMKKKGGRKGKEGSTGEGTGNGGEIPIFFPQCLPNYALSFLLPLRFITILFSLGNSYDKRNGCSLYHKFCSVMTQVYFCERLYKAMFLHSI